MKTRILALLLALLMTAALCACGGGQSQNAAAQENTGSTGEAVRGGEITVGISADLDTSLDPHVSSSSAGTREVLFNIFEGLMKPDTDGNLIPAIAEDHTVNETADEYAYTLRGGVRFHNGAEVTVGDVVYSLSRAAGLDTGEPLVSDVANIAAVEPTENGVIVKLAAPDTEFNAHMTVAIVPEGSDPNADVVGTGPFKFVSRTPQDNIVLERFEDYWGTPAYLDKVTLKVIEDGQTLVMSLRSGAVDMAERLEASQVAELSGLTILEGSSNVVQALYLNHEFGPFSDLRVRQALCYAIDKNAVIDLAADGHGTPVGSSMFPAFAKYFMPELTDYYAPDTAKARELLAEAGYPDGFEFTITVPGNMPAHVDTAQVIAELLREVGVTAKINEVEWNTWLTEAYQGRDFEATVVGMDAHGVAASDMLARFQSTSGKNFISFDNAAYDETYAQAVSTVDEAEQTALFKQCETILTEQAANVYIQDVASFVAMQPDVGGYQFYPLYVMDLASMYRIG